MFTEKEQALELFNTNIKLAYSRARKMHRQYTEMFYNFNIPYLDVEQEALTALWESALKYDQSKNNKFITYAYICISGRIKRFIFRKYPLIKPPRTDGLSKANFFTAMEYVLENNITSLDCPVSSGIDGDSEITLEEVLGKEDEALGFQEMKMVLESSLTKDEISIVYMRYLNKMSQTEIAKKMEFSQTQVGRKLKIISKKLKESMTI